MAPTIITYKIIISITLEFRTFNNMNEVEVDKDNNTSKVSGSELNNISKGNPILAASNIDILRLAKYRNRWRSMIANARREQGT